MINLDWWSLGVQLHFTFALVRLKDGKAQAELRDWVGQHSPHRAFR